MKIIWATDGTELSDRALEVLRDLAKSWTSLPHIVAVHIDQRWTGREMNVSKLAGEEDLASKIQSQTQALEADGFTTGFELRQANRVEDESRLIASIAADSNAQMIVVGTRGHGRFAGALLGSVAQGLLHSAPCPILVVPSAAGKPPDSGTEDQSLGTTATA